MCKYKPQLAKTETPHIVAFLNGTNCSFVDFTIILEMWTQYFYSCLAMGNSLSVTQKLHDFRHIN